MFTRLSLPTSAPESVSDFPKIILRTPAATDFSAAVPPLLQKLYGARGVVSDKQIETGLEQLPKPDMKGLPQACTLLALSLIHI